MVTNETPVGAVYRGFSIIYIGGVKIISPNPTKCKFCRKTDY